MLSRWWSCQQRVWQPVCQVNSLFFSSLCQLRTLVRPLGTSRAWTPPCRNRGVSVGSYLCYPSNILIPVCLGEAQVFVESESHIVAVETVGCEAQVEKVLLERGCDGGFAGCGEAREPDCEATLLAVGVTLAAGEGRVPGDVA